MWIRRNLLNQHTFDFGVCSLAEEYVKPDVSPQDYCKQMYNYVVKQVSKLDFVKDIEQEIQLVGIGEAFLSLGKLSRKLRKYPYDKSHGYSINPTQTTEVYDFVKTLDLDKTKKLKGISTDRADYLASGVAIIKAIQDVSSLDAGLDLCCIIIGLSKIYFIYDVRCFFTILMIIITIATKNKFNYLL